MSNRAKKEQYLTLLKEKARRIKTRKIDQYYPPDGPLARDKYPKHMEFFRSGVEFPERCIMAANRIGKSEGIGAYELTLHMTGRYPDWWEGHRFKHPVNCWAAGTTGTTARDIVQFKLIGPPEAFGTGMIPQEYIIKTTPKAGGVPNAVDTILVRHISGGYSKCKIKSYAEGRKSFEGTEQDIIWLDEECPQNIYTECVTRTMTTNGHILFTFTPLAGVTKTVKQFLKEGKITEHAEGSKKIIMATWDDAPHLTKAQKDKLYAGLMPHEREARSKGIPSLGSGAVYPLLESDFLCEPFAIPEEWKKAFGMDVGWNRTASVWAAIDPVTGITYLYSEYYRSQAEPIIHAEGIKTRGDWIPGVIDPASRGRGQADGKQLFKEYRKYGLRISTADNAVETGIQRVWIGLSTGKIKVFRTLEHWLAEFRLYSRDEDGKIKKEDDHLMDATRYLILSGLKRARAAPPKILQSDPFAQKVSYSPRDNVIGI